MAFSRGALLVVLILLSGTAVGALAGYRMHVHEAWNATASPVNATVTIDYPDGTALVGDVTVQGSTANALGALEALAATHGVAVGVRETSYGSYVHTIGAFRAHDMCGWIFSVGGKGLAYQPQQAADLTALQEGATLFWYWDCL